MAHWFCVCVFSGSLHLGEMKVLFFFSSLLPRSKRKIVFFSPSTVENVRYTYYFPSVRVLPFIIFGDENIHIFKCVNFEWWPQHLAVCSLSYWSLVYHLSKSSLQNHSLVKNVLCFFPAHSKCVLSGALAYVS